jgi:membrane associated rhomboid family serine protease
MADGAVIVIGQIARADGVPAVIVRGEGLNGAETRRVVFREVGDARQRGADQEHGNDARPGPHSEDHRIESTWRRQPGQADAATRPARYTAEMFPVSDVIPSRRVPVVTIGFIVATGVAMAAGTDVEATFDPVHSIGGAAGWAALVRSPFLHLGWLPAAASMICLWIFGDNIENAMGRGAFLVFFLTVGLLGAAAAASVTPDVLVHAGSAPVAAIMTAYFVLYPRSRVLVVVLLLLQVDVVEIPAVFVASLWVILHFIAGASAIGQGLPSAAAFGPLFAGCAAGALAGLALRRRVRWE